MKTSIAILITFVLTASAVSLFGQVQPVDSDKELFITNPVVLNSAEGKAGGSWHFRSALQRVAGAGADVESFAAAWFETWAANETLAGVPDEFPTRAWVSEALKAAWKEDRIQLIGIVNRIDLARFPANNTSNRPLTLGEGRFIYEVRKAGGGSEPFTLIFEYGVPFAKDSDSAIAIRKWAKRWHALGRSGLADNDYLAELKALTDEYSAHGTLNQIRTNEFLAPTQGPRVWQMREFQMREKPPGLVQVPVAITPPIVLGESNAGLKRLSAFIAAKQEDILDGKHDSILREIQGATAPVDSPNFRWSVPAGSSDELRRAGFIFSFNTCNGCHAGDTGTTFQHLGVRAPNKSPFLTQAIPLDQPLPPASNSQSTHDEMGERKKALAALAADVVAPAVKIQLDNFIKARANRVH